MNVKAIVKDYLMSVCDEQSKKLFESDENMDFLGGKILDSLGIVQFLAFVEEKFNVDLVDNNISMEDFSNLNRLCDMISKKLAE